MSVAAVMLVKDEVDVIESTVRHLLHEVDLVIAQDNLSTDGTLEKLLWLRDKGPGRNRMFVTEDPEVGYRQSEKTTGLAATAVRMGYSWVVPVDADEIWYSPFGRLGDVLDRLDFPFASGTILNHVATGADDAGQLDPVKRLGWRIDAPGKLPKVACRAVEGLRIGMGNHDAEAPGLVSSLMQPTVHGQVYIHHYPWRSEAQFLSKITNGARAYAAAPDIGEEYGEHWRQFGMPGDDGFADRVTGWFREWGYRADPSAPPEDGKDALVYDPAPVKERNAWE